MQDRIDAKQRTTITLPEGNWVMKRLSLTDRLRVGGVAAQLIGGPVDQAPAGIQISALMLATVQLATVQSPPEWDWSAQPDDTVLTALYEAWQTWEDSFRRRVEDPPGRVGPGSRPESAVLVSPNVSDPPS